MAAMMVVVDVEGSYDIVDINGRELVFLESVSSLFFFISFPP